MSHSTPTSARTRFRRRVQRLEAVAGGNAGVAVGIPQPTSRRDSVMVPAYNYGPWGGSDLIVRPDRHSQPLPPEMSPCAGPSISFGSMSSCRKQERKRAGLPSSATRRPMAPRSRRDRQDDTRGHPGCPSRLLRQRSGQFVARANPELSEHLTQMPLDGPRAKEQLRPDLRVGEPVAG